MGTTMGCCGKNDSDPNNITTDLFHKDMAGHDKLGIIIKIQAVIRGALARKRVRKLKASEGTKSMMYHANF